MAAARCKLIMKTNDNASTPFPTVELDGVTGGSFDFAGLLQQFLPMVERTLDGFGAYGYGGYGGYAGYAGYGNSGQSYYSPRYFDNQRGQYPQGYYPQSY